MTVAENRNLSKVMIDDFDLARDVAMENPDAFMRGRHMGEEAVKRQPGCNVLQALSRYVDNDVQPRAKAEGELDPIQVSLGMLCGALNAHRQAQGNEAGNV